MVPPRTTRLTKPFQVVGERRLHHPLCVRGRIGRAHLDARWLTGLGLVGLEVMPQVADQRLRYAANVVSVASERVTVEHRDDLVVGRSPSRPSRTRRTRRAIWEKRFDRLETYLQQLQSREKSNARRKRSK